MSFFAPLAWIWRVWQESADTLSVPKIPHAVTNTRAHSLTHWITGSPSLSLSRSLAFMAFGGYWGSPIQLSYLVKYWSSCASARSFAASGAKCDLICFFCACCFQRKKTCRLTKRSTILFMQPARFCYPMLLTFESLMPDITLWQLKASELRRHTVLWEYAEKNEKIWEVFNWFVSANIQ